MKHTVRLRLFAAMLAGAFSLSACAGADNSTGSFDNSTGSRDYQASEDASADYAADSYSYGDSSEPVDMEAEESYDDGSDQGNKAEGDGIDIDDAAPGADSGKSKKIEKEKLIYTCNISIDTLDFDASIKSLSGLIDKNEGFIETEQFSDGSSYDYYNYDYVDDEDKHNLYSATIRIPSDRYETFLNDATKLGDVRSRNSRVDNVSQEYTDLNVSLEIYEAAYDRYMKLLSETKDDEYALKLQQEITDTQIEIARIKTRLNKIDTDVSYSFVNIDIREVTKYDDKPLPADTFGQRLVREIEDTARGFLEFLEVLLFLIINLLPYAALLAVIAIVIRYIRRKMGKLPLREVWQLKRAEREKRKDERRKAKEQAMAMKYQVNGLQRTDDDRADKGDDQ